MVLLIHKTLVKTGGRPVARVTFILPSSIWADTIYLVGDFNGWNVRSHPFSAIIRADGSSAWQFHSFYPASP
jgi:hypothetical protein